MGETKKILVSIPDNLLEEIDYIVSIENTNRSEFIRKAMRLYISQKKKIELRNMIKKGYRESGEINLQYARACLKADSEQLGQYEERLRELEE